MSSNQATPGIPVRLLGQSGCRLGFPGCTIYVDPYLSNSVQELDAPDLARLTPIPLQPGQVDDADWVLITHDHIDHCDPHTLPALAEASPTASFRSEERRVGQECVSTGRSRWSPTHKKKTKKQQH